jgi:CMP-N,N'-diacetyllegionaminic acid synthase
MLKNLVIIPARGGSKGVPGKNLKLIAGYPLIYWSIKAANEATCVDKIVVTTDCPEIAKVAVGFGATVPFLRPASISCDFSSTESALLHCVDWLKENDEYVPDNVILLQPTSPIRNRLSLDKSYKQFIDTKSSSLVSVNEFWHFLWENEKYPKALYNFMKRPRRQDISPNDIKYRENGSIYITKTKLLISNKNRLGGKITCFVMDEHEGCEIDTPLDFLIAEQILKNMT